MNHWIFQANPKSFDVDSYLKRAMSSDKIIYWRVKQKHYLDKIGPGDEVFLWRADGNVRYSGGIVAKGIIISKPFPIGNEDPSVEFWETQPGKGYSVKILLEDVRLSPEEGMIPRLEIEQHDALKNLGIVRVRQQTNFLIDKNIASEIKFLWNLRKSDQFKKEAKSLRSYRDKFSKKSSNSRKNIGGEDLAWIVHGIIIAEGFLKTASVNGLLGLFCLLLVLALSLADWHMFYRLYHRLNPYPLYLWIADYVILAFLAISISKAPHPDCCFLFAFVLWLFSTAVWWYFVPEKFGISRKLFPRYLRYIRFKLKL